MVRQDVKILLSLTTVKTQNRELDRFPEHVSKLGAGREDRRRFRQVTARVGERLDEARLDGVEVGDAALLVVVVSSASQLAGNWTIVSKTQACSKELRGRHVPARYTTTIITTTMMMRTTQDC